MSQQVSQLPASVVAYYDNLFHNEFRNGVDYDALRVTPFTWPNIKTPKVEIFKYDVPVTETSVPKSRVTTVNEFADWLNLPANVFTVTCTDPAILEKVKTLGHRAAGGYAIICHRARKKYGNWCGVSSKLTFHLTINDVPSVADPTCQNPGWISYRLQFMACPQEWLSYVVTTEKK